MTNNSIVVTPSIQTQMPRKIPNLVRIFCPATVANVNCGFDSLGFALKDIGDEMVLKKTHNKGVRITKITGENLPLSSEKNVAGVAAMAMLESIDADFGIEIEIYKNIRSGSGIGSSSASAAGAVFGINQFLERPLSKLQLTQFAMKGEALASGNEHADNVAPCIYGGTTLVTAYNPLHIVPLPPMTPIYVGILHPHIAIHTKEARAALPISVPLNDAITQSQYLAGFITSLYENDQDLFSRSIKDILIEPHRKHLIPHFDNLKTISQKNGTIAFGISGSGPSMFCLAFAKADIEQFLAESSAFYKSNGLVTDTYSSQISNTGCKVL